MALELGLKITKTNRASIVTDLRIVRGQADPLFLSTETETMFVLKVKGCSERGIEMRINEDGSEIEVSGEKSFQELVIVGLNLYNRDREKGFRKAFRIPKGVLLDKIKATFDDEESILTIAMPKLEKGLHGVGIEEALAEEIPQIKGTTDAFRPRFPNEVEPKGQHESDEPMEQNMARVEGEPETETAENKQVVSNKEEEVLEAGSSMLPQESSRDHSPEFAELGGNAQDQASKFPWEYTAGEKPPQVEARVLENVRDDQKGIMPISTVEFEQRGIGFQAQATDPAERSPEERKVVEANSAEKEKEKDLSDQGIKLPSEHSTDKKQQQRIKTVTDLEFEQKGIGIQAQATDHAERSPEERKTVEANLAVSRREEGLNDQGVQKTNMQTSNSQYQASKFPLEHSADEKPQESQEVKNAGDNREGIKAGPNIEFKKDGRAIHAQATDDEERSPKECRAVEGNLAAVATSKLFMGSAILASLVALAVSMIKARRKSKNEK